MKVHPGSGELTAYAEALRLAAASPDAEAGRTASASSDAEASRADAERSRIERHLTTCAACRDQVDGIGRVLDAIRTLPRSAQPAEDAWPRIRERLQARVDHPVADRGTATGALSGWRAAFAGRRGIAWAVAVLLLLVALGTRVREGATPAGDEAGVSNRQVRELLERPAVWDRLEGARQAAQLQRIDRQTTEVLLQVLRTDDNNNVRLMVVTALRRHAGDPGVQRDVGRAILQQQSPVVQMEILNDIVAMRTPEGRRTLRSKLRDDSLQPAVRQAMETALMELEP
jgi:anti-sigma-K factor RskA